jgi:hypothetical protein
MRARASTSNKGVYSILTQFFSDRVTWRRRWISLCTPKHVLVRNRHLFWNKLCSGIIPLFRNKQFIPDKLVIPEWGIIPERVSYSWKTSCSRISLMFRKISIASSSMFFRVVTFEKTGVQNISISLRRTETLSILLRNPSFRSFQSASSVPVTAGQIKFNCRSWVSPGLTFFIHLFIRSSEGIMANGPIRHLGHHPNNPTRLHNITPVHFMAYAKQDFPFSEIISDESAISREDAVASPLFRDKFPVWCLCVRK